MILAWLTYLNEKQKIKKRIYYIKCYISIESVINRKC